MWTKHDLQIVLPGHLARKITEGECMMLTVYSFKSPRDGPFNWDRYTQGVILGAFYYGYILTPIPGGRIAERMGARWLFGIGTGFAGLLTLLIPFVASQWDAAGLVTLRVVQGLLEGVTYPAIEAQIAHWFPVRERGTAIALMHSGGGFGVVAGMIVSGILADSKIMGGWPSIFYFVGLETIIWFGFWALLSSDRPGNHPWISQEEVDLIDNDLGVQKPTHVSLRQLAIRSQTGLYTYTAPASYIHI